MSATDPQIINIGHTNAPRLNVATSGDTGTIKLNTQLPTKSVNFGPGVEMLMNPKKQAGTPRNSVSFENLAALGAKINTATTEPKRTLSEERNKLYNATEIKLDIKELPSAVGGGTAASTPLQQTSNLGATTAAAESKKTETWDGFKQFNSIPIDPDANINEKPKMSNEEILREKLIYLRRLEALEKKGITLTKKYNMDCSLAEMKGEYEMIKAENEKRGSVKFQAKMLMAFVSAIEFMNSKFDPFDIKLDGWGEAVNENIDDYDDVFGELHEKYAGKAKIAPELKLLFMLGGSAAMLHMTNTMFKSSIPGMDDIMRQNPELMQQFTQAAVDSMRQERPGFGGFMSGVMGGGMGRPGMTAMGAPRGPPQPMYANRPPLNRPDIGMSRGRPEFNDAVNMEGQYDTVNERSKRRKRPEMKGPDDIESLLSGLKTKKVNIQLPKESDNKSTISIDELKELSKDVPQRSKRKPRSARNTISLNI